MKRTPLRKMSKSKSREYNQYLERKREMFNQDRFCEWPEGCINRATQIHHICGRIGSKLNDERYWTLLCLMHHTWIHGNTKKAREMGLLK